MDGNHFHFFSLFYWYPFPSFPSIQTVPNRASAPVSRRTVSDQGYVHFAPVLTLFVYSVIYLQYRVILKQNFVVSIHVKNEVQC